MIQLTSGTGEKNLTDTLYICPSTRGPLIYKKGKSDMTNDEELSPSGNLIG